MLKIKKQVKFNVYLQLHLFFMDGQNAVVIIKIISFLNIMNMQIGSFLY